MTYKVGDYVRCKGDIGVVIAVKDPEYFYFNVSVEFTEGGSAVFAEHELEAAE